jgi:hypothetical protein
MTIPFPLKVLRLLLLLTFIIYLPVSIFRSDLFLVLLDLVALLGVAAAVKSKNWKISISNHFCIYALFLFYIICVFVAFFLQSDITDFSALKNLRNLIFGAGVFIISSTYITNKERLYALLRIILWGTLLTSLYGYRQILFGYFDYEFERLALMGGALKEMDALERFRITSTFGDPLLCGYFMMVGVFVYLASRQMNLVPVISRALHPLGLIIILGILVSSLTRAPLLGFVCGMVTVAVFNFQPTPKWIFRSVIYLVLIVLGISLIIFTIENGLLTGFNNHLIRVLNSALSSAWSLTQLFVERGTSNDPFLVEKSRDARLEAWGEGLDYLMAHPFGVGLSDSTIFDFSIWDVGVLKIFLLVGVPGGVAMLSILALVLAKSIGQVVHSFSSEGKEIAVLFLGLWVAIMVTNGISYILGGSVASILIWTVAGMTLNLRQVFPAKKEEIKSSTTE